MSSTEVALGDPAAAMSVLADGRRLLTAEGPGDWRTGSLHLITVYIANYAGDDDSARAEVQQALAVARRLGIPTLLALALALQGHAHCNDNSQGALAAIEEAIGLIEAGAGDSLYPMLLMDAAVLRTDAGDMAGAARTLRTAVDHAVRTGDRTHVTDAVAVATFVLAGHPARLAAAATLDAARHGPVLGPIPATFSAIHQTRIGTAREHVTSSLGPDAAAKARQLGAAMTYDEIIAYTLDQLSRIAAQ